MSVNVKKAATIRIYDDAVKCEKGFKSRKIVFENVSYTLCYKIFGENLASKETSIVKKRLGEILLFSLYAITSQETETFYKYYEKNGYVFAMKAVKDYENDLYEVEVMFSFAENEEELDEVKDNVYLGSGAIPIERSASEIRKEYVKDDLLLKTIVATLLLLGLGYGAYQILFVEEEPVVEQKRPVVKPLTEYEKRNLLQEISKSMIEDLARQVVKSEKNPILKGKRRVETYKFKINALRPQTPYKDKRTGRWRFKTKWKRGGFKVVKNMGIAQSFPGIGFVKKGKLRYVKKTRTSKKWTELDLNQTLLFHPKFLTKKCLVSLLYYVNGDTDAYSRYVDRMEIDFKGVAGSDFLRDFRRFLDECPVYFKTLSLNSGEGEFRGRLVLYAPERTQGYLGPKKEKRGKKNVRKEKQ